MPRRTRPHTTEIVNITTDIPTAPRRRRRPASVDITNLMSIPASNEDWQSDRVDNNDIMNVRVEYRPATTTGTASIRGQSYTGVVIDDVSGPRPSNSEHARFSPSAASRWLACPRSVPLAEELARAPGFVPPADSEASLRGRAMHAVAENDLRSRLNMAYNSAVPSLSNQESEIVQAYTKYVLDLVEQIADLTGQRLEILIEQRLTTHLSDCWGTCDCVVISQTTREVWVVDLKTGRQAVSPEENAQLMIYALGVARAHATMDGRSTYKFHLVIVQPTDEENPIKTWTIPVAELPTFSNRMSTAVASADRLAIPYAPGAHCQYCPAAASCPGLRDRALSVFDGVGIDAMSPPQQARERGIQAINTGNPIAPVPTPDAALLTPNQFAFFLQNRGLIRDFLSAVEARALTNPPPGFKVVEGRGRRRWRWRDQEILMEVLRASHPSLIREMPPTITEAERVLGRAGLAEYTETPPGAPNVVPENDPRPAITLGSRVFQVEQPDQS